MNKKILFFGVLFFALFVVVCLGGCKKDKPVDTPDETPKPPDVKVALKPEVPSLSPAEQEAKTKGILKDLESIDPETAKKFAMILAEIAKQKTAQIICPVMAGEIKKDIFVEYQGIKVYFCCESCKAKFNAYPEKYLPKLPQFKK